jgi:hypothetical protein
MARKAENKWFVAAILFWLFSIPILGNPHYVISIPGIGIDLQPSRILFLFLSGIVIWHLVQTKIRGKSFLDFKVHRLQVYELCMVAYIGFAVLSMIVNLTEVGLQVLIVQTTKLATFLLLYFIAREYLSFHDFYILIKAFVFFGLFSALVGIYQFIVDPFFFRIGDMRPVFGAYYRSNGFLYAEYDQGIYLTMVFIIGMTTLEERWIKALIIILVPLGVFLTMHRASWMIFSIAFVIILLREIRKNYQWIYLTGLGVLFLICTTIIVALSTRVSRSFVDQLIKQRVTVNTLDVRLDYDRFALKMILMHPLGIGEYNSNEYAKEAYTQSMGFLSGRPLVIHNGYLAAGVKNGLLGLILFTLFLFTAIYRFLKYSHLWGKYWFPPILLLLVFLLINLTNDFSFFGTEIYLLLALLIAGYISASSPNSINLPA